MHHSSPRRLSLAGLIGTTLLALCCAGSASAQNAMPVPPAASKAPKKSAAQSVEAQLKEDLEARVGAKIDSVTPMPMGQLYEIRIGEEIFYTDPTGNYLFIGNIVDSRTRENLTRARVDAIKEASLPQWKFSELPLDTAVKIVRGSGKRSVAIFEDPNCGYCKKLEKSILDIGDVTIYVFLYPVLGPDSLVKSKQIWCAPNRAKAWTDWMQNATALSGEGTCPTPLDKTLALGKKLKVDGTPTLFFSNNKRVEGAIGAAELQKLLLAS